MNVSFRGAARTSLAVIRLATGSAGLFVPELMLRRLGTDTARDRTGCYPFRMFGIRTIVLGLDLLGTRGEQLRRATRVAVLIHATDTASATVTLVRGDLPPGPGRAAVGISALNAVLALIAAGGQ